ncbi:DUF6635 family protein [Maliponia aquimaris]|uniref:Uncharacterized protein n=1 Tax=Maliponia aquimaris TaxID=1673631 RepID=A0A238KM39_9RHOB|nr:DUF6635 family protein [Maliponia aquimaris]SMX43939.1 hypothetical protein MAA8898_02940 [Maliponia aquimaris]
MTGNGDPLTTPSTWRHPDRRAEVDAFVARHFTWPGTLRLHRAALGLDVLRAPVNVVMSPLLLLARLAAWIVRRLGLGRAADWLGNRRLLLRTDVAARVEADVLTDLLRVPLPDGALALGREGQIRAILAAPAYRTAIRSRGSVDEAQALAERIAGAVADYSGTRSAIAEFTSALFALTLGAFVFRAVTPGLLSMAPGVAQSMTHGTAVAEFPLGATLGAGWYAVFPVGPSPELVTVTVVGLVAAGSIVAAFAGTLADPVQAWLGIHRRRLLRLMDQVQAETAGHGLKPSLPREHLLARSFDLWDAALSLLRFLRG